MKKIYLIIIYVMALQLLSSAQKIYIPDTAVRTVIQKEWAYRAAYISTSTICTSLYSDCFSAAGDTMYLPGFSYLNRCYTSSLSPMQSPHTIDCRNMNITNMEGLQYLDAIGSIDLTNNKITNSGYRAILLYDNGMRAGYSYGSFSNGFIRLDSNLLSGNVFNFIRKDSVTYESTLSFAHNNIDSFVPLNYSNLEMSDLDLSYNKITKINCNEVGYIDNINFSNNLIATVNLYSICGVTTPCFAGNCVNSYRNFSNNLINFCEISAIGFWQNTTIDSNFVYIDLSNNKITDLKNVNSFINRWQRVNLSGNNLQNTSHDYPLGIAYYINLDSCNLSFLPEISEGVIDVSCKKNKINSCLTKLPSTLRYLYVDSNILTCLPNYVPGLRLMINNNYIPCTSFPICNPTNNVNGCIGFPTIIGKVYFDKNNNLHKDTTEPYLSNIKVDNGDSLQSYTDGSGSFFFTFDSVGQKIIHIHAPQYYTAFPDSIGFTFSQNDTMYNVGDIPIQVTTFIDSVYTFIVPTNWAARPGFDYNYSIFYGNKGTTTVNPTITVNYDSSKLQFVSCTQSTAVNNGNSISFSLTNFNAADVGNFNCRFTIKPTTSIGDTIKTYSTIIANAAANADTAFTIVRGSYDPNDKLATPTISTTQIAAGDYINYIIRFQNTGNDTAFNIVLADTLSTMLQPSTLQIIGSSHTCKTTSTGNKLYFEFKNINLPDSHVNVQGSNGYVRFRVKPLSRLAAGNIIPNKASIYFDYNKAVITNLATTKVVLPSIITPLHLINYSINCRNSGCRSIINNWTTANEVNVSHFNIQRSIDGKEFITIGKIKANNKSNNEYGFVDNSNSLTTNNSKSYTIYYRIVAVDNDGKLTYSEVKVISINNTNSLVNVYPNPSKDFITIENNGVKTLTVVDCFGRVIQQYNNLSATQLINIKHWSRGVYILNFDNGEKIKLIKE